MRMELAVLSQLGERLKVRNPKKIFFLVLLVCAMAAGWRLFCCSEPEPEYRGKPLSAWLAEYHLPQSLNWPRQDQPSDAAIRAMGTNCFPTIIKALSKRDTKLKRHVNGYLRLLRVPVQLPVADIEQGRALAALGALRWDALPMIPYVAEALEHMDFGHRAYAGFWLESFGADAEAAVPAFLRILTNQSDPLRHLAVQSLSAVGAGQKDRILPILTGCLNDTNPFVRLQARNELTREPWAVPTRPRVTDIDYAARNLHQLEFGTESERAGAASYFRSKPHHPERVVPLLISGLTSANISLIEASAKALGAYGEHASNSVAMLESFLAHPKKYVRAAASNALVEIRARSRDVGP